LLRRNNTLGNAESFHARVFGPKGVGP